MFFLIYTLIFFVIPIVVIVAFLVWLFKSPSGWTEIDKYM